MRGTVGWGRDEAGTSSGSAETAKPQPKVARAVFLPDSFNASLARFLTHTNRGFQNMAIYVINHKVENFENWKKAYDAFQHVAEGAGVKDHYVLASLDDPNHVVVIGEGAADDLRHFLASDGLKSAMVGAGVVGKPDIFVGK